MTDVHRIVSVDQVVDLARLLSSSLYETLANTSSLLKGNDDVELSNDSLEVDHLFQPSQDPYFCESQSTFMMSQTSSFPSQSHKDSHHADDGMYEDILNAPASSAQPARPMSSFQRLLNMPFRSEEDYLSVARIMRVLQIIIQARLDGVSRQIRGVYYDDKPLFKKQEIVSKIVDKLESYFEVPSSHFSLTAAPIGLFAGPVAYSFRTREEQGFEKNDRVDYGVEVNREEGLYTWGIIQRNEHPSDRDTFLYKEELIQDTFRIENVLMREEFIKIDWVMVIEKETCFTDRVQQINQYIETDSAMLGRHGHGVMVTGKGMPDKATRRWLELLADKLPDSVPFYAFMDGDAYGMHICHIYQSPIQYYVGPTQQLAQRLQWIGLKPSNTLSILQKRSPTGTKTAKECGAILLDLHERNRALYLVKNDNVNEEIKDESLRLMIYGYKLELEAVASESLFSFMPTEHLEDDSSLVHDVDMSI